MRVGTGIVILIFFSSCQFYSKIDKPHPSANNDYLTEDGLIPSNKEAEKSL